MYAVALMTFDIDITLKHEKNDFNRIISLHTEIISILTQMKMPNTLGLFQRAIYLNLLNSTDWGKTLIRQFNQLELPDVPLESSRFHERLIIRLINYLNLNFKGQNQSRMGKPLSGVKTSFTYINEYYGLPNKILPIDSAVFYEDKLVAFVEVDGPHHYNSLNKLKRQSQLKEHLYKSYNKSIPFFRISLSECNNKQRESIRLSSIGNELMNIVNKLVI